MMRITKRLHLIIVLVLPLSQISNLYGFTPISIPSGVNIEVSGEVEVEFIDVEGPGGASNEDNLLKKIETRSPHTRIDKAMLEFKLLYSENITYDFSFRFDDDDAYLDKHYLTYKKNNTKIELGKNRPAVALKRSTEGYPLIGTAYWKGRQYHLDAKRKLDLSFGSLSLGGSIALKRPLDYDDAVEDKSFKMLVYGDNEKVDGQTVEYGVLGSLKRAPFKIQGWYYTGNLIDDEDWKKRLHYDFDYYADVEPDNVLGKDANITHSWYGGRAELTLLGTLIRSEYIYSEDGFLVRDGYYLESSKTINLPGVDNLFTLIRYGQLRIDPGGDVFYPQLKDPHTWNRSLMTIAFGYNITGYSKLKVEYYILDENTGDTKTAAEQQNRDFQEKVKDNQLLIQLELKF